MKKRLVTLLLLSLGLGACQHQPSNTEPTPSADQKLTQQLTGQFMCVMRVNNDEMPIISVDQVEHFADGHFLNIGRVYFPELNFSYKGIEEGKWAINDDTISYHFSPKHPIYSEQTDEALAKMVNQATDATTFNPLSAEVRQAQTELKNELKQLDSEILQTLNDASAEESDDSTTYSLARIEPNGYRTIYNHDSFTDLQQSTGRCVRVQEKMNLMDSFHQPFNYRDFLIQFLTDLTGATHEKIVN